MVNRFLNSNSEQIFEQREAICLGMSPFNSYFSENTILQLTEWALTEFQKVYFFVPDVPSAYTLEALGYPAEKAAHKARRQCQYLKNKITKSWELLKPASSPIIVDWNFLDQNNSYNSHYQVVTNYYQTNLAFRDQCWEASKWVLEKRVAPENLTEKMLEKAVLYFLSEIPIFSHAVEIFETTTCLFAYHQSPIFLEKLFDNQLVIKPHQRQGYLVLEDISKEISMVV